jgi:non-specific serine/threonine protein kinase
LRQDLPVADPTPADRSRPQTVPLVPLADRDRPGAALPAWLTGFVGREREVAEVCALLRGDARLVTLTGPGGVGKTRLAARVAASLAPGFPDGVVFVGLAPVADPALVLPTVAQTLGVREGGDRPLVERLGALLGERRQLVVLDNLEHLAEVAPRLAELLAACPRLSILATSRAVLRLSGEQVYPVSPLALPEAARSLAPTAAVEPEAVALFVQRARGADPGFALTAENAATVAEVVRRLDGLPLAIELAATRVRSLTPAALLARLSDRLRLLTGGARDLPDRQRTMRDTIAWSHDLLSPEERVVFRRLSVFIGGFTLDAAEAVCGTSDSPCDVVASLVDQSLLLSGAGPGDDPRYSMLETVREYGLERLAAEGDVAACWYAHADYFTALAMRADREVRGANQVAWLDRLEADHPNLRAALDWLQGQGRIAEALCLAVALTEFWFRRDHLPEGRARIGSLLAGGDEGIAPRLRARAREAACWLYHWTGTQGQGEAFGQEALELWRALGDAAGVARMEMQLGSMALNRGAYDQAEIFCWNALTGAVECGDATASYARNVLAIVEAARGNRVRAAAYFEKVRSEYERAGDLFRLAAIVGDLGHMALFAGDLPRARALYRQQLDLVRRSGNRSDMSWCLAGFASIAAAIGQAEAAVRLFAAVTALNDLLGEPFRPVAQSAFDRIVEDVRAALGEAPFAAAWAAGRTLTPEEAVAEALAVDGTADASSADEPRPSRMDASTASALTRRELEVLRLVADGRSDREIAAALFIGPATVHTHLANAFGKLEVSSRTAAVASARRLGIL